MSRLLKRSRTSLVATQFLLALSAVVGVSGSLSVLAFQGGVHDLAQTPADLTVVGAAVGDDLGRAVATGDFNGDGIADLLLGAPDSFSGCQISRAFVYRG